MSLHSRRQLLQGLGAASTAAFASLALPAYGKRAVKRLTVPDPKSLYLIFTGAWAFCYEDGRLNAVTTNCDEHSYDLGVSLPSGQPRMPLEKDQTYTVSIGSYAPTSIQNLIDPMVAAKQGLIFKGVQRSKVQPKGLRTISLPLPSSISPAALLTGASIVIDPSQTQIPIDVKWHWPAAIALVYSGAWEFATITSADDTQEAINIVAGSLPYPHLSFRTFQTAQGNLPLSCAIDCDEIRKDIQHAKDVYDSMMGLLDFQGKIIPTIDFPPCVPTTNVTGGKWPVAIARGDDSNIDKSEIGMPANCQQFSHLHNCAAGTMIVGT